MVTVTLEQLLEAVDRVVQLLGMFDAVNHLEALGLVTAQEALQLRVRIRAQLRQRIDAIPRDEG